MPELLFKSVRQFKAIALRCSSDILYQMVPQPAATRIVFSSSDERRWLEQQIHPYVRDRLVEAIDECPYKIQERSHPPSGIEILLIEAG